MRARASEWNVLIKRGKRDSLAFDSRRVSLLNFSSGSFAKAVISLRSLWNIYIVKYIWDRTRIKLTSPRSLIRRVREPRFSFAIFLRGFGAHTLVREPTWRQHIENVAIGLRLRIPLHALVRLHGFSLHSAHDEIFMLHLPPVIFNADFNPSSDLYRREAKLSIKYAPYLTQRKEKEICIH